jgi:hypothetical protein
MDFAWNAPAELRNQLKTGDKVICSETPGVRYEIMDVLGEGDVASYRLRDGEGNWYGYVGPGVLKKLSSDL